MLDWNDLWAACALYLIIEGLMPFLNPGALKLKRTAMQPLIDALSKAARP